MIRVAAVVLALVLSAPLARAAETTLDLSLTGTSFAPAEIIAPPGQAFVIRFTNHNARPAELESEGARIEKIVDGGATAAIRVRALKPGTYQLVDEFQEDAAKATLVVK